MHNLNEQIMHFNHMHNYTVQIQNICAPDKKEYKPLAQSPKIIDFQLGKGVNILHTRSEAQMIFK